MIKMNIFFSEISKEHINIAISVLKNLIEKIALGNKSNHVIWYIKSIQKSLSHDIAQQCRYARTLGVVPP